MTQPKELIERLMTKTQEDKRVGLRMVVIRLDELEWLLRYIVKDMEERT